MSIQDSFEDRRSLGSSANLAWVLPAGWCIVFDPTNARRGSWVLHWEGSADPPPAYLKQELPVEPGQQIEALGFVKRASGSAASGRAQISWRNAAGAEIDVVSGDNITGSGYGQSRLVAVAPAGAVAARLQADVDGTGAAAHELFFDDLFAQGFVDITNEYGGQNLMGANAGPLRTSTDLIIYQYFDDVFVAEILLSDLGLDPGRVVSLSYDHQRASSAGNVRLVLTFYDSDGSGIGTASLPYGSTPDDGTWARGKLEGVIIPALTYALRVTAESASAGSFGSVRRVMLNEGPKALPFSEPPTRVERGEVEEGATVGATAGTNLRNSLSDVLSDDDISNDRLVANFLGGAIIPNPGFDIARVRDSGTGLRPVGWFFTGASEGIVSYVDATRDAIDINPGAEAARVYSQAVPVKEGTSYRVAVRSRSDTATGTIPLRANESTTPPSAGKSAFHPSAHGTFADPRFEASKGATAEIGALSLTASQTLTEYDYTPSAGTKWVSFGFAIGAGVHVELDYYMVSSLADVTENNTSNNVAIRPLGAVIFLLVDGNVTPSQTTVDRVVEFTRNGVVATRTVRVTRSGTNLTWSNVSTSGEATTVGYSGNGTSSAAVTVSHTASGEQVVINALYVDPSIGTPTK